MAPHARTSWCGICRGGKDGKWITCADRSCRRVFHPECVPEACNKPGWVCEDCTVLLNPESADAVHESKVRSCQKLLRAAGCREHASMASRISVFYSEHKSLLAPFIGDVEVAKLINRNQAPRDATCKSTPCITPEAFISSPHYVHARLRQYQVEGVRWLLSRYCAGVGGILGDEMGLGKTIETLAFVAHLKEFLPDRVPVLVVTPLSVLQNWCREIRRFTPGLTWTKVAGQRAERSLDLSKPGVQEGSFDVYLTTYEAMMAEEAFFTEALVWRLVVIDEGHRIKNDSAKLCESLGRLPSPFRILLTGTPIQNGLRELWSLLQYLLPEALARSDTAAKFASGFAIHESSGDAAIIGSAGALLKCMMLRRLKVDVVNELPPKAVVTLFCPLAPLQKTWYLRASSSFEHLSADGTLELLTPGQLTMLSVQLQKICNHPKQMLKALDDCRAAEEAFVLRAQREGAIYAMKQHQKNLRRKVNEGNEEATTEFLFQKGGNSLEQELRLLAGEKLLESSNKLALLDGLLLRLRKGGSRVLIFSHYRACLDVLEEYFQWRFGKLGTMYFRLDGQTNRVARETDTRAFNAPGSAAFAYLISTKAGGVGLNLATADTVVLFDSSWNPHVDLQAMDRAHRIGQTKPVRVYRLCCESTIEERIVARCKQKMRLNAAIVSRTEDKEDARSAARAAAMVVKVPDKGETSMEADEADEETPDLTELRAMLRFGQREVVSAAAGVHRPLEEKELHALLDRAQCASDGGVVRATRIEVGPKRAHHQEVAPPSLAVFTKTQTVKPSSPVALLDSDGPELSPHATPNKSVATRRQNAESPRYITKALLAAYGPSQGCPKCEGRGVTHNDECKKRFSVITDVNCPADSSAEVVPPPAGMMISNRPKRTIQPPQRYEPYDFRNNTREGKRRCLSHRKQCFECGKGGPEMIACSQCVQVYHLECVGLEFVPKGIWRCPWHTCRECSRTSTLAGGTLLHCFRCPETFCIDCIPEEIICARRPELDADRRSKLLKGGMTDTPSTPSAFIDCLRCKSKN